MDFLRIIVVLLTIVLFLLIGLSFFINNALMYELMGGVFIINTIIVFIIRVFGKNRGE